ncbi:protein translocase subunit SecF [Candidatus Beckwithbacteria bacterium CG10_big_fil_rev_8_21_14_0_10_34_10]|uniref:Protein-export membrane protein SecF n=1 Tax=Candidatus Beckwithbacteria bacterium CG10_big_fil_rev_8_21_14_0_10_34_10 TaxID=1974495 RepID=A0A2H0W8G0_9BACT|nr:MAG: protein translocase subunit SecF [Candidatus Beckwithbacteria bacterium CG10_big_fil_rev_8_21_14_0_10_34_10]
MKLDFLKYKYLYFLVSGIFLIPAVLALVFWGLKPAVDFTGGSVIELRVNSNLIEEKEKVEKIIIVAGQNREENGDKLELSSLQSSSNNSYILKLKEISKDEKELIIKGLEAEFGEVELLKFATLGPSIGKELIRKTVLAIILAAGFIFFYVGYRFKDKKYGVCAILAMFHDTLILLGAFAILGHFFKVEVDTLFVTAVLTILSFSVHDTVVVYDRIRESIRKHPDLSFEDLVNKAIGETLTRSINNSMTIIFMLLCLYLLGGETIRWFTLALLIGTVAGTYSSTFTAAPLLVVWEKLKKK